MMREARVSSKPSSAEAAVVLLQRVVPAAEHLERLGQVLARQRLVLDARRSSRRCARSSRRTRRPPWKLPRPNSMMPTLLYAVMRSHRSPSASESARFILVVLQRVDPVAELPERVAEVRRGDLAELLGADLLADCQRVREASRATLPVAEGVLDEAEHVHDVAEDDVRLGIVLEHRQRALGRRARALEIVLLAMKPGDAVEQSRRRRSSRRAVRDRRSRSGSTTAPLPARRACPAPCRSSS